ncbi:hypothetical protein QBC37DRAFT_127250 [Rhypophila decipiens]|uniref:Uncharacterized protein n=1 Tax=Rhypophila decipiens TaxID=261697 RepID=A0AAN6YB48_9PEZI|nr:hypothetical protein QBC37DRAFT_127250 [Rhypophila decipiens]
MMLPWTEKSKRLAAKTRSGTKGNHFPLSIRYDLCWCICWSLTCLHVNMGFFFHLFAWFGTAYLAQDIQHGVWGVSDKNLFLLVFCLSITIINITVDTLDGIERTLGAFTFAFWDDTNIFSSAWSEVWGLFFHDVVMRDS